MNCRYHWQLGYTGERRTQAVVFLQTVLNGNWLTISVTNDSVIIARGNHQRINTGGGFACTAYSDTGAELAESALHTNLGVSRACPASTVIKTS